MNESDNEFYYRCGYMTGVDDFKDILMNVINQNPNITIETLSAFIVHWDDFTKKSILGERSKEIVPNEYTPYSPPSCQSNVL